MYTYFYTILFLILMLPACTHQEKKSSLATNYFEQASLAMQDKDLKKALQLLNKSLAIKEIPQALAFKATLLYQLQDFEGSVALFEKIINYTKNISPSLKADIKNNYACVLNHKNEGEKAVVIWIALTKDPDYLTPEVAYFNLGLYALTQNDIPMALQNLYKAVELTPDYVDAYFYLGVLYMQQESLEKAKAAFESLLSYAPEHPQANILLQQITQKIGAGNKSQQPVDDREPSHIFSLP